MSEQPSDLMIPVDVNALSFDSFQRDPQRDVVCLTPIRTIIRREEEIVLVRKVRKVEEVDAGLACPVNSISISDNPFSAAMLEGVGLEEGASFRAAQSAPSAFVSAPAPFQAEPAPVMMAQMAAPQTMAQTEAIAVADQPAASVAPGMVVENLVVDSRRNCLYFDSGSMSKLQHLTSITRSLQPGTYTITLKSGSFDYYRDSGFQGEPLVLLWIYGGKVANRDTGVKVGATWSSLNGLGDTLTLDVEQTANICAFFFDTYLDDNEGEVVLAVEGAGYAEDLVVHSQRNCYFIAPDILQRLEQEVGVSATLQPGTYAIRISDGRFNYNTYSGHEGEPLCMLWIYGGRVINRKTGVAVGATWSSLNGYEDVLTLDVMEPTTVCAFLFDTYLEDNQGEVILTVSRL